MAILEEEKKIKRLLSVMYFSRQNNSISSLAPYYIIKKLNRILSLSLKATGVNDKTGLI